MTVKSIFALLHILLLLLLVLVRVARVLDSRRVVIADLLVVMLSSLLLFL